MAVEVEQEMGYIRPWRPRAAELEARGWKEWLLTLFPFWFEEEFSAEHEQYWELRWTVFQRIKRGEPVPEKELNCILLLARGLGKSAVLEAGAIMRAALLGKGYVLLVSETDDQATEHLGNCRILIEHPDSKLLDYYPEMAVADDSDVLTGMPTSDRKAMFICKSGHIFRAKGLNAKMRGLRVGVHRPDHIIFDDIDDVNDSFALSLSKESKITASIIGVQARENVTIDAGQNLITEHSFFNRIYTSKSDALAERTVIGVTNAFTHLDIESRPDPESGGIRHYIADTSIPSWAGLNITRAQKFLHDSGLQTFLAEYQNEFDQFKSGKVIPEYSPETQRISWSMFEEVFGQRRIPAHWRAKAGLDVGYSEGQYPHYSAWAFIAAAAENSAFPGLLFVYRGRAFKGVSIDDQATIINNELFSNEKDMVSTWQMSHERTGEMLTLRQKYDLPFSKFQYYKAEDGVAQWRHLSKADKTKPHPFLDDKKDADGEYQYGRPTLYYIVDDGQLKTPKDDNGLYLLHQQVSSWNYVTVKITESGQTQQKPSKRDDDFADVIKSVLALFGPPATRLTKLEQREAALPPQLQDLGRIIAETNGDAERLILARQVAFAKQDEKERDARVGISKVRPQAPRIGVRRFR